MYTSWIRLTVSVVAVATSMTFTSVSGQQKKIDYAALRNADKTGEEWLTYGRNYAETRYSPLDQINAANVRQLGLEWWADIPGGNSGHRATPLVSGGILYSISESGITYAVDARNGREKWRYDPESKLGPAFNAPRGVAIYEGRIFVPVPDGRLVALNAETGAVLWSVQTTPNDGYYVSIAPRVVKGKVLIGNSGGETPVRGFVSAYESRTGKLIWRFYTVPGDPRLGFENDAMKRAAKTWSGEWFKFGGGGNVWDAISFDPDLNLVYIGTANGGPWPQQFRQSEGKDNLFIASVLALNLDNGTYKWHFQFTPGDSWDYDATQQLILADLLIDGRKRKVIMQANKNGFFYVLDRINGNFISAAPYARVNWASRIDKTGRPIVNPAARYGAEPVCISPGPGGAHTATPMSFSTLTGLVYVFVRDPSIASYAAAQEFVYASGRENTGAIVRYGAACSTPQPAPQMIGPVREQPKGQRGFNWLVAWDPVKQMERWSTFGGGIDDGGVLSTSGNLVFILGHSLPVEGAPSSRFAAYKADTGELLLDVPLPDTAGLGPPITFALEGKQYVTFSAATRTPRGDFRPTRYAFALGGKTPIPGKRAE